MGPKLLVSSVRLPTRSGRRGLGRLKEKTPADGRRKVAKAFWPHHFGPTPPPCVRSSLDPRRGGDEGRGLSSQSDEPASLRSVRRPWPARSADAFQHVPCGSCSSPAPGENRPGPSASASVTQTIATNVSGPVFTKSHCHFGIKRGQFIN